MSGVNKLRHYFCGSFLTALLRYNSNTTQFTHWKCTLQQILVYSQSCASITMIDFSSCPKEPFSYHPPPPQSPQPQATTALLSVSRDISYPWNHTYAIFVWLPSLSMFSRLIRIVAYIKLFLFMADQYFIVWLYHILFIHSSVDGHLCISSTFWLLWIAINFDVHMFCGFMFSFILGIYLAELLT